MPTSRKTLLATIAALAVLIIAYQAIVKWPREKIVPSKQAQFIEAIEKRKWGRVHRMLGEDYGDSLGLDRDTLQLALRDVSTMLRLRLDLNWQQTAVVRDGDRVKVSGTLRIDGEGGPGASAVTSYARRFANQPFTFTWKKTGALPWNWQLVEASHPDARLPEGYTPGEIRERLSTGDF